MSCRCCVCVCVRPLSSVELCDVLGLVTNTQRATHRRALGLRYSRRRGLAVFACGRRDHVGRHPVPGVAAAHSVQLAQQGVRRAHPRPPPDGHHHHGRRDHRRRRRVLVSNPNLGPSPNPKVRARADGCPAAAAAPPGPADACTFFCCCCRNPTSHQLGLGLGLGLWLKIHERTMYSSLSPPS